MMPLGDTGIRSCFIGSTRPSHYHKPFSDGYLPQDGHPVPVITTDCVLWICADIKAQRIW